MKKLAPTCLFILLFAFLSAAQAPAQQETFKFAIGEWPPCESRKLPGYGFCVRIVDEALAQVDIKTSYEFFPWPRSLAAAKMGDFDGTFVWSLSYDKKQYFAASDPIMAVEDVFFHQKGNPIEWKTVTDLAGKKIGGTIDYYYGKDLARAQKNGVVTMEWAASDEINFNKLFHSRIDAFICNRHTGLYMLHHTLNPKIAKRIAYNPKPVRISPLVVLISKATPNWRRKLKLLNLGLRKLKQSGRWQEIMNQAGEVAAPTYTDIPGPGDNADPILP